MEGCGSDNRLVLFGNADAVAARLFCPIERGVGTADDHLGVDFARRDAGDAEAAGHDDRIFVPPHRMLFEVTPQRLGHAPCAGQRRVGQQDEELFSAVPALQVAAAKHGVHARCRPRRARRRRRGGRACR